MLDKNRNNAIVEFLLSVDTTLTQIGTQCKAELQGELLSDGRLVVILYLFFFSIKPGFFNKVNQYVILRQS